MKQLIQKLSLLIIIFVCSNFKILGSGGISRYVTHENNAVTNTSDDPSACSALSVAKGGTGLCALTAHYLLVGNGTSAVTLVAPSATSGNPLVSQGVALDPAYSATPSVTSITISNAPVVGTDGTNKTYVDFVAAGLNIQSGCVAATTSALTVTYANGAAGVGATLTNAGALAAFSIDGQSPTVGQRVLIKNQASQLQNGIYTVTTVGSGAVAWVLTRATDFDTPAEITPGDLVPVNFGTVNANTLWLQTATVTTVGTDAIVFQIFLQPGIVNLAGNSGTATGTTVTVSGGNNITTSAAGSTLTVNVSGTTDHAVQIGNATNSLTSLGLGTTGQALVSAGAGSDPAFGTLPVAGGGTGATTITNHGVLVGQATSAVVAVGPSASTGQILQNNAGADPSYSTATYPSTTTINRILYSSANDVVGQITTANGGALVTGATGVPSILAAGATGIPLVSQGVGAQPAFSTAVVAGGGTGVTSMTAYALLAGGTTSTNPVQSLTTGTAGQTLMSNGASALPTWVSGLVQTATVTLSTAQVLALNATPITVIAAPASGNVVYVINAMLKNNFVTSAFASATGTIDLIYTGLSGSPIITGLGSNAFVTAGAINLMGGINGGQTNISYSSLNGIGVQVSNPGAAFTGGGTSTITVAVNYVTLTI